MFRLCYSKSALAIVAVVFVGHLPVALAQKTGFVAPPRSIADITAILDQEKPDPAKRAKLEAEAAAEPPADADRYKLKDFYYKRGQARASLGRLNEAVADSAKAVEYAPDYLTEGSRIELYQEEPDAPQWRLPGGSRDSGENGAKAKCDAAPNKGAPLPSMNA